MDNSIIRYIQNKGSFTGISYIDPKLRINIPMKSSCRVSIVIPVFNEENMIENCLSDLNNQMIDKNKYEIIIIDNNSGDNTLQVLDKWIRDNQVNNVHFLLEKAKGVTAARRRGFDEVILRYYDRGNDCEHIILSADGDNRIPPNWIETYLDAFNNSDKDIIFGDSEFDLLSLKDYPNIRKFLEYKRKIEQVIKKVFFGRAEGNNFGVKLKAYTKIGGFKHNYLYTPEGLLPYPTDDWVFSAELIKGGAKYGRCDAKVLLNPRKFKKALNEIIKGTVYLDHWEDISSRQDQESDLNIDQLAILKQSQLQGIIVHQMLINLVADAQLLTQKSVRDFLGNKLYEDIVQSIKIAKKYCNNNEYDIYDNLYIPSYFVYVDIGKQIIARLEANIQDESFTFTYPKEILNLDQFNYDWQRYLMIVAFLHAPDKRIGEYFGSWL